MFAAAVCELRAEFRPAAARFCICRAPPLPEISLLFPKLLSLRFLYCRYFQWLQHKLQQLLFILSRFLSGAKFRIASEQHGCSEEAQALVFRGFWNLREVHGEIDQSGDTPATAQAIREALVELSEQEKGRNEAAVLAIDDDWMEEGVTEQEEEIEEAPQYVTAEKEDEKEYADRLWSQVDSSQSC